MPRLRPPPRPRPPEGLPRPAPPPLPGGIALGPRVAVRCLGPRPPGRTGTRRASGFGRTRDGRATVKAAAASASLPRRRRDLYSCLAPGLGRAGARCRESTPRCHGSTRGVAATPPRGRPRGSVLGGWGGAARGGRWWWWWWCAPSRGAWPPTGPGLGPRAAGRGVGWGRGRGGRGPRRGRPGLGDGGPAPGGGGDPKGRGTTGRRRATSRFGLQGSLTPLRPEEVPENVGITTRFSFSLTPVIRPGKVSAPRARLEPGVSANPGVTF